MARIHRRANATLGLVCCSFLFASFMSADEAEDKEQCGAQLKKIHGAIQAYRKEHKDLPNWLSDLKPQYLPDEAVFVCPRQRRAGQVQTYEGLADPRIKTSYAYEFCTRAIPANTWGGDKEITMRTWKGLQMGVLGGKVPLVRCFSHGQALNLSFDGEIWESELTWEQSFSEVIEPGQLGPRNLMERFKIGAPAEQEMPSLDLSGFWSGKEAGSDRMAFLRVQNDEISFYVPENDEWYRGTFMLDASTDPARVTCTITACPSPEMVNKKALAIVKKDEDRLLLAGARPGSEQWPDGFSTSDDCRVFEFQRKAETSTARDTGGEAEIPDRDPQATPRQIDLSKFYNASLRESWHTERPGNDLRELPTGLQELDGTKFDVRGLVQVSGPQLANPQKTFPRTVSGIPVNLKTDKLHFLHGTGFVEADGVEIAQYVIHYADGEKVTCPILYGQTVRDWWYYPDTPKEAELSHIAWTGNNEAAKTWNPPGSPVVTLRLYKTSWKNPRPQTEITSIDLVSKEKNSAPFLIAITAE